jgi:uncharacterized protein (AIM24 family)
MHTPQTIASLLDQTTERPPAGPGAPLFELETGRIVQVNLDGRVWIKAGAMVAYRGRIRFEREGILSQGLGTLVKKTLSGEGASLTSAQGQGELFLADKAKRIMLLSLADETIFVNGNDLLCLDPGVRHEIIMMRKASAMLSGGLFNIRLSGPGLVAIATHHRPLTFRVTPDNPLYTDPQATVAWSGTLTPELHTDLQFKSFLGRGSGESFQMRFQGEGFVIVQPYEERPLSASS